MSAPDEALSPAAVSELLHSLEVVEIISEVGNPSHLASALWYADKVGWPVFMLKPRGKAPLTDTALGLLNGFKHATTDVTLVRRWWEAFPDANLGAPTGLRSAGGIGFDVIDLDGDEGQRQWATVPQDERPEVLWVAMTPGDGVDKKPGRHLYIEATGDPGSVNIMPKVDYRGTGSYVALPPSMALHGVRYEFIGPRPGRRA